MNPKQKKFCDEYIKSGNAKQSAIKAGYSPKTAYSIGNDITPMGIAFYVAPYVNATIRMGSLEEK